MTLIAKEIRASKNQRRANTNPDLRDLYQAKVALLQEVLETVRSTHPESVWRQISDFEKECIITHRLCRNPGLKIYLRIKTRTVKEIVAAAKAAA